MRSTRQILVVHPYEEMIGPHYVIRSIIRSLQDTGYCFTVVMPRNGPVFHDIVAVGGEPLVIPNLQALRRMNGMRGLLRFALSQGSAVRVVLRHVTKRRPDVIHSVAVACVVGGVAARMTHIPSVYHVHDLTLGSPWAVGVGVGFALSILADRLVCVSDATRLALPLSKVLQSRAIVAPNGVDLNRFRPDPARRFRVRGQLGISKDAPVIGAFGAIDRRKGQHVLLSAAKRILQVYPEAHFLVAGAFSPNSVRDGYQEECRRLVADPASMGHIHLLGFRADIPELMCSCDVICQPSYSESGPLALAEAMASGIPVVGSNVGGIPERLTDSVEGYLVKPGDPVQLETAVVKLLSDRDLRLAFGRAGRRKAANFDISRLAAQISGLYEELLGNRATRPAVLPD